jgi:translation initiation factor 2 subunit 2
VIQSFFSCPSRTSRKKTTFIFFFTNKMNDEGAPGAEVPLFDPTQKKKKKKVRAPKAAAESAGAGGEAGSGEGGGDGLAQASGGSANGAAGDVQSVAGDEYSYEQLLHRAFELIGKKPDKSRVRVPLPEAFLVGTSRTLWANFPAIVKALNRSPQHLLTYVIVELGTTANLDGNGRVVIRGRFMPKQLESLLKKYIGEYVVCKTCGGRDTVLKRENRLHFLVCQSAVGARNIDGRNPVHFLLTHCSF